MGNMAHKGDKLIKIDESKVQRKSLEDKSQTKNEGIEKEKYLYEPKSEIDITNEDDVLHYICTLQELLKKKELDEKSFISKLEIYTHGISDQNYAKYFSKFQRQNSKEKIFNLLDLIMMDLDNDIMYYKKKTFFIKFSELSTKEELYHLNFKKIIYWKNKELYLYNIYYNFLKSLGERINYRKKLQNKNIEENELYKFYIRNLNDQENEDERKKIKDKIEILNLIEGDFFKIYLFYFQQFLNEIKDKFEIKFKNNDLEDRRDQLLFEDFIQLLSTYEFNGNENRLASIWKYAFVPITMEQKISLIEYQNNANQLTEKDIRFFLTEYNGLRKIKNGKNVLTIDNIHKYDLYSLLVDLTQNNKDEYNYYYLNKNLIPSEYDTNLFVKKKEMFWKQLLISILGSHSINECVQKVFNHQQTDRCRKLSLIPHLRYSYRLYRKEADSPYDYMPVS